MSISVQPEVVTHLHRTLGLIRAGGCEAGVALNPTTPPELIEWALPYVDYINVMSVNPGFGGQDFIPEMVEKVRRLKEMTDVPIEVDGGITAETAPLMVEAGAQVLIAGSAVFKGDPEIEMRRDYRGRAASQALGSRHQATGQQAQDLSLDQDVSRDSPPDAFARQHPSPSFPRKRRSHDAANARRRNT